MATRTEKRSDILIDKRLLSIDFDDLNLLQSCMLLPKPVNIVALKKRLRIPLTKQDLLQDIQDKNSPIHKYLQAMILCQITRILLAKEEEIKHILAVIHKKQRQQAEELLDEIEREELRSHSTFDSISTKENYLPPRVLLKIHEVQTLRDFFLHASKYEDLKYYSQLAKDKKTLELVQRFVERRYELIARNFELLRRMRQLAQTPEEIAKVNEVDEAYIRHLELASRANTDIHLSHVPLENSQVLAQHVQKEAVNEEVYTDIIKGMVAKLENVKKLPTKTAQISNEVKEEQDYQIMNSEKKDFWQYRIFRDKLNDLLENYFDQNSSFIVKGFRELIQLQTMLFKVIHNGNSENFLLCQINSKILNLKTILKREKDKNYIPIIDHLQSWDSKKEKKFEIPLNADKKTKDVKSVEDPYIKILGTLQSIFENKEVTESCKLIIKKLYKELESGVNSSTMESIINYYNELVKESPDLSYLKVIYTSLVLIPTLDIEKLREPTSDFNYGL